MKGLASYGYWSLCFCRPRLKILTLLHYDKTEKAIPIILDHSEEPSTINQESGIINKMTEPINILRIYACENVAAEAEKFVRQCMKDMCDQE